MSTHIDVIGSITKSYIIVIDCVNLVTSWPFGCDLDVAAMLYYH